MAANRDPVTFRHELAERVHAELQPEYSRVSPYFGEQYADSSTPEARALRRSGGTFEWVAFGFDPYTMWDAHVGVLTTDGRVIAGFHVHERLAATMPESVEPLAEKFDATYQYSEAAAEHQFNCAAVPLGTVGVETFAGEVAEMCRQFDSVVDEIAASS